MPAEAVVARCVRSGCGFSICGWWLRSSVLASPGWWRESGPRRGRVRWRSRGSRPSGRWWGGVRAGLGDAVVPARRGRVWRWLLGVALVRGQRHFDTPSARRRTFPLRSVLSKCEKHCSGGPSRLRYLQFLPTSAGWDHH